MSRKKNIENSPVVEIKNLISVFKPLTIGQNEYAKCIDKNIITICVGHAGCGKTHIAAAKSIEYLRLGKIEKIIILRTAIESHIEKLGALPGLLEEKYNIYTVPISEEINKIATQSELKNWKSLNKIEYSPIQFIRGRTFENSFIIVEEANNCTFEQLILILTRLGKNSKMVISGDLKSSDLPKNMRGGLYEIYSKLSDIDGIGTISLHKEDVVRHGLISKILEKLL